MKEVIVYGVGAVQMPVNYEAAKRALAECVRVDQVKEIRDRAVAISTYAVQKRDKSMFEYAERIKARATLRFGELVNEQKRATRKPLKDIARASNSTMGEVSIARAVTKVPRKVFEEKVERSPPASVSTLAKLGQNKMGADESGAIWKAVERVRALTKGFPAEDVQQSCRNLSREHKVALRKAIAPAIEWLDAIDLALK